MANVETIQEVLCGMPIGSTGVRWGRVVTRVAKDAYELDTIDGRGDILGSESTAEILAGSK